MLQPSRTRTCVLYDSATGHIVHVHKEITLEGGLERNDNEIEQRTRHFAARRGRSGDTLKVVFVEAMPPTPHPAHRKRHWKVDPGAAKLIEGG
ncbi:MAG TPA: hypothetical protein VKR31_08875 [Rhizomicrobium sp.]|nr:hypothetical protein [Rhizomicrobium sp.]